MGRALFGQTAVGGRLPVNIPGVAALGAGLDLPANPMKLRQADAGDTAKLQPAYDVLDRAVADHAFPGGVLAVGYQNELFVHAFGRQTYDAKSPAVNGGHDLRCRVADQTGRDHNARGHAGGSRAHRRLTCPWRATFPNGMTGRTPTGARR